MASSCMHDIMNRSLERKMEKADAKGKRMKRDADASEVRKDSKKEAAVIVVDVSSRCVCVCL